MALFVALVLCVGFFSSVFFVQAFKYWLCGFLWGGYLYLLQNGQVSERRIRWAAVPRNGEGDCRTARLMDEQGRLTPYARLIWTALENKLGNGLVYSFAWASADSSCAPVDVHNGYFLLCRKRIGCVHAKAVLYGNEDSLMGW